MKLYKFLNDYPLNFSSILFKETKHMRSPKEISDYMKENEARIAKIIYSDKFADQMYCQDATEVLSALLRDKKIPHEIMYRKRSERSPEPHYWIRADGIDLDPTDQGTWDGKVVKVIK